MNEKEFKKLINKKHNYQILILGSKILKPTPILHTWIVTIKKGKATRWDFGRFQIKNGKIKDGIFKNLLNPYEGVYHRARINALSRKNPDSGLIKELHGNEKSIAHKMVIFLEKKADLFPYTKKFKNMGPNCNTFVQWIINKFPDSKIKLPFGAIGKNYKKRLPNTSR